MLQFGSKLKVADNSGAHWAKCIGILGKGNKKCARAGSILLLTVIKFKHRKKVKKRTMYLGFVISVSVWVLRNDGTAIKFFSNRLLVFTKQYKFLGTRVYGIALKEVRSIPTLNKKTRKFFQKSIIYNTAIV